MRGTHSHDTPHVGVVRLTRRPPLEVAHCILDRRPARLAARVGGLHDLVEHLHRFPYLGPDMWGLYEYETRDRKIGRRRLKGLAAMAYANREVSIGRSVRRGLLPQRTHRDPPAPECATKMRLARSTGERKSPARNARIAAEYCRLGTRIAGFEKVGSMIL